MNHNYHISVIIPVYNVEAYIANCLDSVLAQSDKTVEIICVNDGSPDNSRRIISDYMLRYPCIKCIDRPNSGLSAARNSGIREATGEYIVLLDSDDWLEKDVLSNLYNQAKEQNADVLVGNTKWIYPNKETHIEKYRSADIITSVISGVNAIVNLLENEIYVPMAYNYICKRNYIVENNLFFKEGLIYEDELWTPHILISAKRVVATKEYHYNYLQRDNTITSSVVTQVKIDSAFYVAGQLIELAKYTKNQLLKNCIWKRAYIVYNKGVGMHKMLSGVQKQSYMIQWTDLFKSGLNYESFNFCLAHLTYSKSQRRILRIAYRAFTLVKTVSTKAELFFCTSIFFQ